jgi:hypothetical protein
MTQLWHSRLVIHSTFFAFSPYAMFLQGVLYHSTMGCASWTQVALFLIRPVFYPTIPNTFEHITTFLEDGSGLSHNLPLYLRLFQKLNSKLL